MHLNVKTYNNSCTLEFVNPTEFQNELIQNYLCVEGDQLVVINKESLSLVLDSFILILNDVLLDWEYGFTKEQIQEGRKLRLLLYNEL